jgi:ABC-type antimicrobial peptide transport system permease subunit
LKNKDTVVDLKVYRKKKLADNLEYYRAPYSDKFLTPEESQYLLTQLSKDEDQSMEKIDVKYVAAFTVLIVMIVPIFIFILATILL